ncbi:DUF551 domain-containing protein [Salmonella enterica subsp. salamae serovar 6,7:z:1,5]|nr:DUF551 domain-containing protein [Salmonella enterica subsp. salamae serovar 6,7:z:1,5]
MTTITKLTKEQLIEEVKRKIAVAERHPDSDVARIEAEIFKIALASMEAKPVAWECGENIILFNPDTVEAYAKRAEISPKPPYTAPLAPAGNEFIPKNLDKALGVVGVALPESKEEFNFQIERWIQRLIDRVIRYADEFKEQPVPVVPDEWTIQDAVKFCRETGRQDAGSAMEAWNACRAAMLHGDTFRENSISSTNNFREIAETSTNSPVIPDDWVMVPKEPTQAMIKAWLSEVANFRGHAAGYRAALAASPQREIRNYA